MIEEVVTGRMAFRGVLMKERAPGTSVSGVVDAVLLGRSVYLIEKRSPMADDDMGFRKRGC